MNKLNYSININDYNDSKNDNRLFPGKLNYLYLYIYIYVYIL